MTRALPGWAAVFVVLVSAGCWRAGFERAMPGDAGVLDSGLRSDAEPDPEIDAGEDEEADGGLCASLELPDEYDLRCASCHGDEVPALSVGELSLEDFTEAVRVGPEDHRYGREVISDDAIEALYMWLKSDCER